MTVTSKQNKQNWAIPEMDFEDMDFAVEDMDFAGVSKK